MPAAVPARAGPGWSSGRASGGTWEPSGPGAPGWAVTVGLPPSQALDELWQLALGVGLFGAVGGLLGLVAAWNLGRRYRAAVRRLQGAVKLLGRGTVPAVVPGRGTGELALLADDLNQAVARLRRTFSEYEVLTEMEEAAGRVIGSERAVDAELPGLLRRVVGAARSRLRDPHRPRRGALGHPGRGGLLGAGEPGERAAPGLRRGDGGHRDPGAGDGPRTWPWRCRPGRTTAGRRRSTR